MIKCFLELDYLQRFRVQEFGPQDISWYDHFSRASDSPEITKCLLDKSTLRELGPRLPETFIAGVKLWKDKHLASDPESAREIDDLCLELESMSRGSPTVPEDADPDTSEGNEAERDDDERYNDAIGEESDEDDNERYEDAVEELEIEHD
ncbi:hypothetical protein CPB83DRAFT_864503 [Crepidotus variabilis]|uniref:Uncharacterized protein n=1 Tax=Crepidotus variabilis TaxID=179855 RepID=A0A9P6JIN0_9AGAR|nr:hypothetical protein CPB83DRAFT_864503 [Crepidotus variabilis]